MNTLIEKIEALYDKRYQGCESVNEVINDVLDIIKAEFVEKDLPDCGGSWLRMREGEWVATELYRDEYTNDLYFLVGEERYVNDIAPTKWVKAIMPKE